ncbi:MAG: adenine phosphoribosyltransferase [Verrucomicrobia bacterium]|nr:adenine phosphoribosyltransferase [Verrucomicrobiota bacterium]MCH8512765.1 adenine phosphoribosyltransferase [Kiritimatiellia bacterium]
MSTEILQQSIRDIPDFPKPGIVFKDITPFLRDPFAFGVFIDLLVEQYREARLDVIVAIDARGFLFGGALARALNIGLVPVRKKGKLPWSCISEEYDLEYGSAIVEMHADALKPGERVLILDDLLATGGTVAATLKLCRQLGAEPVACAFLIELSFLQGREKLGDIPIFAPIVV